MEDTKVAAGEGVGMDSWHAARHGAGAQARLWQGTADTARQALNDRED